MVWRPSATRAPFASQISQSSSVTPLISVVERARHKIGPGAGFPRTWTVNSTVGTHPTLGTNVKAGGGHHIDKHQ